jgi:hypothetical protein
MKKNLSPGGFHLPWRAKEGFPDFVIPDPGSSPGQAPIRDPEVCKNDKPSTWEYVTIISV